MTAADHRETKSPGSETFGSNLRTISEDAEAMALHLIETEDLDLDEPCVDGADLCRAKACAAAGP